MLTRLRVQLIVVEGNLWKHGTFCLLSGSTERLHPGSQNTFTFVFSVGFQTLYQYCLPLEWACAISPV